MDTSNSSLSFSNVEMLAMKLSTLNPKTARVVVLPRSRTNSLIMVHVETLCSNGATRPPCCWISEDLTGCVNTPPRYDLDLVPNVLRHGVGRKATEAVILFLLRRCICAEHFPQARERVKEIWIRSSQDQFAGADEDDAKDFVENLWQEDQNTLQQEKRSQIQIRFPHITGANSYDAFTGVSGRGLNDQLENVVESAAVVLIVPLEGPPRYEAQRRMRKSIDARCEDQNRGDGRRSALAPEFTPSTVTLDAREDRRRARSVGATRSSGTETTRLLMSNFLVPSGTSLTLEKIPWTTLAIDHMRNAASGVLDRCFITQVIKSPLPRVPNSEVGYVYIAKSPELDLIKIGVANVPLSTSVPSACPEMIADCHILNVTDQPLQEYERLAQLVRAHLMPSRCLCNCNRSDTPKSTEWQLRTGLTEWFCVPDDVALETLQLWRLWLSSRPYRLLTNSSAQYADLDRWWQRVFDERLLQTREDIARDARANLQHWSKFLHDAIADEQKTGSSGTLQSAEAALCSLSTAQESSSSVFGAPSTFSKSTPHLISAANSQPEPKPPSSSKLVERKQKPRVRLPKEGPQEFKFPPPIDVFPQNDRSAVCEVDDKAENGAGDAAFAGIEPCHVNESLHERLETKQEKPESNLQPAKDPEIIIQPAENPEIILRPANKREVMDPPADEQGTITQPANEPEIIVHPAEPAASESERDITPAASPQPPPAAGEKALIYRRTSALNDKKWTFFVKHFQAMLSQKCPAIPPRTLQEELVQLRWPLISITIFALLSPHLPAMLANVIWICYLPLFVAEMRRWRPAE